MVGSGFIQFPPQRRFEGPLQMQPPTVAVGAGALALLGCAAIAPALSSPLAFSCCRRGTLAPRPADAWLSLHFVLRAGPGVRGDRRRLPPPPSSSRRCSSPARSHTPSSLPPSPGTLRRGRAPPRPTGRRAPSLRSVPRPPLPPVMRATVPCSPPSGVWMSDAPSAPPPPPPFPAGLRQRPSSATARIRAEGAAGSSPATAVPPRPGPGCGRPESPGPAGAAAAPPRPRRPAEAAGPGAVPPAAAAPPGAASAAAAAAAAPPCPRCGCPRQAAASCSPGGGPCGSRSRRRREAEQVPG